MNCFIKLVGVIDTSDRSHFVELSPGLNIITGKSSTGKSAIVEIMDYCFGSSDFTIPDGVITTAADLYFIVLAFPAYFIVLARRSDSPRAFIKEEPISHALMKGQVFNAAYFEDAFFIPLDDFKKELGRHFGITMADVDEEPPALRTGRFSQRSKSPTPSVRTFMSFMLQHQNLIANKHAIFYRFDQKEKREQAIEHFKILITAIPQRDKKMAGLILR